jgi:hypothetical protein
MLIGVAPPARFLAVGEWLPSHPRQFADRLPGFNAAPPAELDELRDVDPPAAGLAAGDPPLALADTVGQLPLGELGPLAQLAEERGNLAIDQGLVPLGRHRAELSAADGLKRF